MMPPASNNKPDKQGQIKLDGHRRFRHSSVLFLLFFLIGARSLIAQEASLTSPPASLPKDTLMTQKHLFGDWGGARTRLAESKGVSFDFHYIGDFLANP